VPSASATRARTEVARSRIENDQDDHCDNDQSRDCRAPLRLAIAQNQRRRFAGERRQRERECANSKTDDCAARAAEDYGHDRKRHSCQRQRALSALRSKRHRSAHRRGVKQKVAEIISMPKRTDDANDAPGGRIVRIQTRRQKWVAAKELHEGVGSNKQTREGNCPEQALQPCARIANADDETQEADQKANARHQSHQILKAAAQRDTRRDAEDGRDGHRPNVQTNDDNVP
jgi:hypothetical protein